MTRAFGGRTSSRTFFKRSALSLAIKVGGAACTYLMFLVLARLMPAAEYGIFGILFTFGSMAAILCCFGQQRAAIRFLPEYGGQERWADLRGYLIYSISVVCVASVLFGALLLVSSQSVSLPVWLTPPLLTSLALFVVAFALAEFVAGALRASGDVVSALAPRDIVWRILLVTAAATEAYVIGHSPGAGSIFSIGAMTLLALALIQFWRLWRILRVKLSSVPAAFNAKAWTATSVWLWGAATLTAISANFDTVILGMYVAPEKVGPYFAALKTAAALNLMMIAVQMVSMPLISRHYHQAEHHEVQRVLTLSFPLLAAPAVFGLAVFWTFSDQIMQLFGPEYAGAGKLLQILAVGMFFSAIGGSSTVILQVTGHERASLFITAVSTLFAVLGLLTLTPVYGATGAAVSKAAGLLFWNMASVLYVRYVLKLDASFGSLRFLPSVLTQKNR